MPRKDSNADEQENELLALESIFSDEDDAFSWTQREIISEQSATVERLRCGKIAVAFEEELLRPLRLRHRCGKQQRAGGNDAESSTAVTLECVLNRLPSITLIFALPSIYPSSGAPYFALSAVWLDESTNSSLRRLLLKCWSENEGLPVLYSWIELLREQTASCLPTTIDLTRSCDKSAEGETTQRARSRHGSDAMAGQTGGRIMKRRKTQSSGGGTAGPSALSVSHEEPSPVTMQEYLKQESTIPYNAQQRFTMLEDYEELWRRRKFEKSWHPCGVCVEERRGSECVEFSPCKHVFCAVCTKAYFQLLIKEGKVTNIGCLSNSCRSSLLPNELRRVLNDEALFERYDRLLLAQTLDLMNDIVVCPRLDCQQPVLLDQELKTESALERCTGDDRMASCATCQFAFCVYCRKGYHGLAPCAYTSAARDRIVEEYLNGDGATRCRLERRFGAVNVKRLVEDFQAEKWKDENSQRCPKCKSSIEKNYGCNKVLCIKCDTAFCWLCKAVLQKANPYKHFNSPGNSCYNLLFQGAESDDEDWGLPDFD